MLCQTTHIWKYLIKIWLFSTIFPELWLLILYHVQGSLFNKKGICLCSIISVAIHQTYCWEVCDLLLIKSIVKRPVNTVSRCIEFILKRKDHVLENESRRILYWVGKIFNTVNSFTPKQFLLVKVQRPTNNLHILINRWRFSPFWQLSSDWRVFTADY